jgi:hypothetical protein
MLYIDYICPPGLKAALNGNSEMSSNTWTHEIFQEGFSLVNSARFACSVRPHEAMRLGRNCHEDSLGWE